MSYAGAVDNLGDAIDNVQTTLGEQIDSLASNIDNLSDAAKAGDVAKGGVTDGGIIKLQYAINKLTGAAEHGTSIFTKAEANTKRIQQMAIQ
ncbi:hypothetical protein A3K48_00940 [candidate division WOR-1 bacterium RIFOXYA12_FULL_52_29]|uniref:Uncharacterized protein n=1 Tax=candidate division WOR-1 bacterium RIFOXYC12_FULL_54_18 TaxID=1802584 RepID=A0A1F4T466_UNCSA|nr:MAG: hypothetical protein A3K44_00940 [candidate division WOR-1 bacterium RIFOXYA2_FULL_51_19]OGC17158.1 MAG: hypothetical protein A3K48_00940 [candidate division WOR-1 bacterium RIFOXYA12_FULL_52_29]OGC26018.1 MAG: hypothetical protein A3K32_00935 [candidate division WOR-1 bacterium RIFOXYB2_FULL_45_9]OGC27575.1 MAG: hypothetical protein A3K49_00940 [candidate division WOR-1 bacterium RIFOXYC12_FULL_54_18]OGC29212.1 MAG: hypothetical protein A2346_00770 [candidate division WOR-1 bacterium R